MPGCWCSPMRPTRAPPVRGRGFNRGARRHHRGIQRQDTKIHERLVETRSRQCTESTRNDWSEPLPTWRKYHRRHGKKTEVLDYILRAVALPGVTTRKVPCGESNNLLITLKGEQKRKARPLFRAHGHGDAVRERTAGRDADEDHRRRHNDTGKRRQGGHRHVH